MVGRISQSQANVEFEISLPIAVTTSLKMIPEILRDDMMKGLKESGRNKKTGSKIST